MPWSGWARAPQLLSLCSGAHGPQLLRPVSLEPVLRNGRGRRGERATHHCEEWPPLASTREKPVCSNADPMQPKININK